MNNYKSIRQMSLLVGVIAIAVVLVIIPNNTEEESQSSSENTIGSEYVHGESVAAPSPTTIMPSGLSAEKKQELLKRTAENIIIFLTRKQATPYSTTYSRQPYWPIIALRQTHTRRHSWCWDSTRRQLSLTSTRS